MARRAATAVVALALALALGPALAGAAGERAYSILAPGEYGGMPAEAHSRDQLRRYDALAPLGLRVRAGDLPRFFVPETLRPAGRGRVERTGRRGLRIVRDRFGLPHVYGRRRADVMWGAGWVAGEDRPLLLEQARGVARAALADVPGLDALSLITSGRSFTPSRRAEALVTREARLLVRTYGAKGRQMLRDFDAYAAGVSAEWRHAGVRAPPWTRNDVIAVGALIGAIFGTGGGAEARNAAFLAELEHRLGARGGARVFRDLAAADDPEAPVTAARRFPYGRVVTGTTAGSPPSDRGSLQLAPNPVAAPAAVPTTAAAAASNALLVGARRSASGRPLAVMGPQLGYFYPAIVYQEDLHGPGIHAQGSAVPGAGAYILIGRARRYAWSLTSATNDNIDLFLERLCDPGKGRPARDSTHYLYRGRCRAMGRFDAGVLGGSPPRRLSFSTTVHGPVVGTVTVHGRPYALARARTTYGRDALSLATLKDLTEGRASSPARFLRVADELEWTFNVFWVSARHIGYFSAGRLPRRAPGINSRLPTLGTGRYDWRGFLSGPAHPHAVDPRGGLLLNWNNRPAPGWIGGDNTRWSSVQRAQLFRDLPRRRVRLEQVVGVMNRAATEDLRAIRVWPAIRAVLGTGPAPDARTRAAAALVTRWVRRGASRLDRNLDGTIDDPGAAVLDAAFVPLARAALSPVLGPLTDAFALLYDPDQAPYRARNGSAFADGWYGYLDKDLRTLLGRPVRGRYSRPYCGRGRLAACRASLWAALKLAADGLAARQGPKPAAWRSDATLERIRFRPGLIPDTMRWVNRPTFQQVLELAAPPRRRPRFTG